MSIIFSLPFTMTQNIPSKLNRVFNNFRHILTTFWWVQFGFTSNNLRHATSGVNTATLLWHLPRQLYPHTFRIPNSQGKRDPFKGLRRTSKINPKPCREAVEVHVNCNFFPQRILSYLVSQRLLRLNRTTSAAVASSSSLLASPAWSQVPVGFSQELRDGVAKSFKVRSKDYFQNLHAINYNKSKLAKQSLFVSMPWLDKTSFKDWIICWKFGGYIFSIICLQQSQKNARTVLKTSEHLFLVILCWML